MTEKDNFNENPLLYLLFKTHDWLKDHIDQGVFKYFNDNQELFNQLLPDSLRLLDKTRTATEEIQNNKMYLNDTFPNLLHNLNIKGDHTSKYSVDKDYKLYAKSYNADRQFFTNGDNNLHVEADGELFRNYKCKKLNSTIEVDSKKYVAKEIKVGEHNILAFVEDNHN